MPSLGAPPEQHAQATGRTLPLEVAPGGVPASAEELAQRVQRLAASGATRLALVDEPDALDDTRLEAVLTAAEAAGLIVDCIHGVRAEWVEPERLVRWRSRLERILVSSPDPAAVEQAARIARSAGMSLSVRYEFGATGQSAEELNVALARAIELYEETGARPVVRWGEPAGALSREMLESFRWTFEQRMAAAEGPEKLILNVTYVCNNRCTFCAVGTRPQVNGHPARQREHLEAYRAQGVRMVDFDGGEPTLNPELIPLIRYARHLGFQQVHVTTNGRLCAYEEFARRLVRSGLTSLLFSLHGPNRQIHAQHAGVAEAFDQTVQGIRHVLKHAPPGVDLGLNITVTKGNYRSLGEVAALVWELGLRWFNIQFLTPFGRATSHLLPDSEAAAAAAMRVIDEWQDRLKLQVINLPFCLMPGYERFMAGDLGKQQRQMIFVNNEDVNLAAYLTGHRVKKPECAACPHAVFCGGLFAFDKEPEPASTFLPSDLDRPRVQVPPAGNSRGG